MSACRLGFTEHDGSRFCHEHAGRVYAGSPTPWVCDATEGGLPTPTPKEDDRG